MYPQTHFLFPLFIGLVLMKLDILSWKLAVLAGVIGVVIDLDHYIEHILYAKTKRFSLIAAWNNSIKLHRFNQRSFIHYTGGAMIVTGVLLLIALFSWTLALAKGIGYYSHLLLDHIHLHKGTYLKARVFQLWLKEPYEELALDILLVLGVAVLIFV